MTQYEIELKDYIVNPKLVTQFIHDYTVMSVFFDKIGYIPDQETIEQIYKIVKCDPNCTYIALDQVLQILCCYENVIHYTWDSGFDQWINYKTLISPIYYDTMRLVRDKPFTDIALITEKGKLGKRVAKHIFKTYGVSVKSTIEYAMAHLSGQYVDAAKLTIEIDNRYDLINGTVGDDESCIFTKEGCNRHQYYRLAPSEALVVRAYTEKDGFLARAILFKERARPNNLIMINGYGRLWMNGRSRDTQVIDRLAPYIATILGKNAHEVFVHSVGFWVNNARGVLFSDDLIVHDEKYIEIVKDKGHEHNCVECSDLYNDREEGVFFKINDKYVCKRCYKDKYEQCSICLEHCHKSYMRDLTDYNRICNNCINNKGFVKCSRCDKFCHHDNIYTFDDYHFCPVCMGKLQRCNKCGKLVRAFEDGGKFINSLYYGLRYLCNSCTNEK